MKSIRVLFDRIFLLLPYLIVFIYSLYTPADPDLGWHLKYGEYFWQHGKLLRDNTFSTMMPNFHWANTSWLTDIIAYTAYHLGGFLGLTVLAAVIVTLTFYFFAKAFSLTLWQQTIVFPFILYLEEPINAIAFRGQQLDLLLIGILFYLISMYEKKPRILWFTVLLFLFWVNIDGEFLLGYALFGLWVVLYIIKQVFREIFVDKQQKRKVNINFRYYLEKLKSAVIEEKKEILPLFVILVCCLIATFITPFGYNIFLSVLSFIGNPHLKDIGEYLPFAYLSQDWWNEIIVGIILVFGLFILGFRGIFLDLMPILGGGLLLFVLSLQIRRYAWPAYYLVFPLLAMTATFLKPDGKKTTKIATTILLLAFLIIVTWVRYPFTKFTNFNWSEYCRIQVDPCSQQSVQYLLDHHLTHNLFTLYSWGGWLIWNYPQIKPSIDGRMHMWEKNGYSAFTDYYAVEQNFKDIDKTSYTVVYMTPNKPDYDRLVYLSKVGKWRQVYKDQFAGIFVRSH